MSCTPANSCGVVSIAVCASPISAASPGASYGSNSCPDQLTIQNTNPPKSGKLVVTWSWSGNISEADCPSAKVNLAVYAGTSGATPTLVGTHRYIGVWSGHNCVMNGLDAPPEVACSLLLTEVRASISATVRDVKQPIKLGFWHICN